MYQLHLQFVHPPMLPFQFAQTLMDNHFHHGRFFPLEFMRKVLAKGDQIKMDINENTDIGIIIGRAAELGVSYDAEIGAEVRKCKRMQDQFAAWKQDHFGCVVSNGKVLGGEGEAKAIQAADVKGLQNYGRPYSADGKPSGSYYKFAKSPADVSSWA